MGVPRVALHIRRGDVVNNEKHKGRFSPDSWYYAHVDRIRRLMPEADVHVFSSTEGKWTLPDFQGYLDRNMTVHLDGDPLEAWAHFASVQVLVMAKSSFSQVPALLNPNCVIYQPEPYGVIPLSGWLNGAKAERPALDRELRECIQRSWSTKK